MVAEELQSTDSTSLTAAEKIQFRSTGRHVRFVAGMLVASTVATGAGIRAQETTRQDVIPLPQGNILIGNDRTTSTYSIVLGNTFANRQAGDTTVPASGNLAEAVKSLRVESGLTWDQLGRLFGVSRRAMHLWANGGKMNAAHAEALSAILQIVRNLPGSGTIDPREALLRPSAEGRSVYDELRDRFAPDEDAADSSMLD
jgi:transcriptional regulator with XRE-family HTH domain